MTKNVTVAEMAQALMQSTGRIVITAHIRPDGDAAGAALGLCLSLRASGRQAVCVGIAPLGDEFNFLEGLSDIIPAARYVPAAGDEMAIVDCGDFSRIAPELLEPAKTLARFCIDHHKSNAGFASFCLIDPAASSASELVYAVLQAGRLPLTRGVAEALWVGLVTDTGRFSYSCTSPDTLRRAAVLLEHGARIAMINDRVYCQIALRRLRLQRRLLESLEVVADGLISVVSLVPEDYEAEHCSSIDSDNFVDVPRSVKGTLISVFLRQVKPDGFVNISLRTHDPFDASQICAEWGGGGHTYASGATVPGDVPSVRTKVLARLTEIVSAAH